MLLSTGSNEIQQLRWNSSLGLVFGADSLKPWSSKCRSMRSSHGAIQPPPSMTKRGRRSRNSGSMYLSHRSSGSRIWLSASTTLYARAILDPSEGDNRLRGLVSSFEFGKLAHEGRGDVGVDLAIQENGAFRLTQHRSEGAQFVHGADGVRLKPERL